MRHCASLRVSALLAFPLLMAAGCNDLVDSPRRIYVAEGTMKYSRNGSSVEVELSQIYGNQIEVCRKAGKDPSSVRDDAVRKCLRQYCYYGLGAISCDYGVTGSWDGVAVDCDPDAGNSGLWDTFKCLAGFGAVTCDISSSDVMETNRRCLLTGASEDPGEGTGDSEEPWGGYADVANFELELVDGNAHYDYDDGDNSDSGNIGIDSGFVHFNLGADENGNTIQLWDMELEGEDDDLGPFKLTLGAEASGRRVNGVNYEFDPGDLLFMVRYENNKGTNYAGIRNDDEKLTLSIDWEARTFEFDVNLVGPVIELDVEGSGDVTQTPPFAVIGTDSKLECTGPDGVFEVLDASPSFDLEADPWTADWVVDGTRLSSSGTQLGLGAHEVGLVVVDEVHRSSGSKAAVISVEDTTAPDLICPAPATAECSVPGGAQDSDAEVQAFLDGASSADVCDLSPSLANDVQSFLDLGPNTVTFSSEDDYSNESTCDAVLTVIDTVAPVVACPEDLQIECNAFGGVSADDPAVSGFLAGASASDVCDASLVVLNDAPGFFGVGNTSVTFQTADDSGNIGACTATVIVVDTTPPELSVSSSPDVLWPPNHKMETVSVDFEVSDICDPDPTVHLVKATSDEPDNGQGDGNTVNDIQGATLGTEDVSVLLRRERSGSGDGRTYTLEYTATDDSENSTSAATTVDVPHSKPK